jgi:hypothetical protein
VDTTPITIAPASDDANRREVHSPTSASRPAPTMYARKRGGIGEVRLEGSPEEIGYAHSRLLYRQMVATENAVQQQFAEHVPLAPMRGLLTDVGRVRFRHLDQHIPLRYRREIAAQAIGFSPDPFDPMMATYQRFVFLQSLYDIALSFEHSPMVGCTSFTLNSKRSDKNHVLLGRNFDMEGPEVLDKDKVVFLIFEQDEQGGPSIPYASVSWPGFIGVSTGVNAAGLAVVLHGARAGEAKEQGEPVAHTVRALLAGAHSTREAIALLAERRSIISHMLLIADPSGHVVVAERIAGEPPHIRQTDRLTNHLEGPGKASPENIQVMKNTSTMARRRRLDERLENLSGSANVKHVVAVLRDKKAAGGGELPLGDRAAIDALIATHSVAMNLSTRTLWVSEGPSIAGRFIRFDLAKLLDRGYRPSGPAEVVTIDADGVLSDGRYAAWKRAGSPHARSQP